LISFHFINFNNVFFYVENLMREKTTQIIWLSRSIYMFICVCSSFWMWITLPAIIKNTRLMWRCFSDIKVIAEERNNETIINPKEKVVHQFSTFIKVCGGHMFVSNSVWFLFQPLNVI
jgi:hypothetical protein